MPYREQATIIGADYPCWCKGNPPSVWFNQAAYKAECFGCLLWRLNYTSKSDVEAVQCVPGIYERAVASSEAFHKARESRKEKESLLGSL